MKLFIHMQNTLMAMPLDFIFPIIIIIPDFSVQCIDWDVDYIVRLAIRGHTNFNGSLVIHFHLTPFQNSHKHRYQDENLLTVT